MTWDAANAVLDRLDRYAAISPHSPVGTAARRSLWFASVEKRSLDTMRERVGKIVKVKTSYGYSDKVSLALGLVAAYAELRKEAGSSFSQRSFHGLLSDALIARDYVIEIDGVEAPQNSFIELVTRRVISDMLSDPKPLRHFKRRMETWMFIDAGLQLLAGQIPLLTGQEA